MNTQGTEGLKTQLFEDYKLELKDSDNEIDKDNKIETVKSKELVTQIEQPMKQENVKIDQIGV